MKLYSAAAACLLLLAGLALPAPAGAFCIYNRTDEKMGVIQESGGRFARGFQANLEPGAHACCNWKDKDCNKAGHKDSILTFTVPKWFADNVNYCTNVRVKAGGWMDIEKKDGKIRCTAHY